MTTAAIKIGLFRQGKLTNQHRIGGENMGEAIFRFHAVVYMCLQIWRDHRDPALLLLNICLILIDTARLNLILDQK